MLTRWKKRSISVNQYGRRLETHYNPVTLTKNLQIEQVRELLEEHCRKIRIISKSLPHGSEFEVLLA